MTCFSWTLPAATPSAVATQSVVTGAAAQRQLFGVDIWLDVTDGQNADRVVTPAGDWKLARDVEVVRQSLLRRLVTNPGDWPTKPDYGVGARAFVKKRATQANADELVTRIRGQFSKDARVDSVVAVTVEWNNGLMRVAIAVKLKGRTLRDQPLLVQSLVR